ncbi:Lysophospholipase-like protein 1 [Durusdinium trenchii]
MNGILCGLAMSPVGLVAYSVDLWRTPGGPVRPSALTARPQPLQVASCPARRRRMAWLALLGVVPKAALASAAPSSPARVPAGAGSAAIVFLHGSGDSGTGFKRYLDAVDPELLEELQSQEVQTFWPDSEAQPYTLAGGMVMPIWYDRSGLPPSAPEKTDSVERSVQRLMQLIQEVEAAGVPPKRIVIGGFSMGGGIALQLALRHPEAIAGAFVLSSFMCDDAAVYERLQTPELTKVPILMMHGEADRFIRPQWGRQTAERLKSLGVATEFVEIPGLRHEMSRKEIQLLRRWLWQVLQLD